MTPESRAEAKTLFELLHETYPGRYDEGQLRTSQRRERQWRAAHGPERETVLAQKHRAGEAAQTDFTWATELGATIAGQVFAHMLCVLCCRTRTGSGRRPVCVSESMAALRRGVQRALFQLGRVPRYHQTDCSTAATHRIPDRQAACFEDGRRPFDTEYVALMRHLGMTPRTTEPGAKEQNGDVEAGHRAQAPARAGVAPAWGSRLRERGSLAGLHRRAPFAGACWRRGSREVEVANRATPSAWRQRSTDGEGGRSETGRRMTGASRMSRSGDEVAGLEHAAPGSTRLPTSPTSSLAFRITPSAGSTRAP